MNNSVRAVCLCLCLCLLMAFWLTLPARADDAAPGNPAPAQTAALPPAELTADVLYRLLGAELAAQRGQYELAGVTLLELARQTQDPRLAQRAFQFAMLGRDGPRALAAARQWARLASGDPEALAAVAQALLARAVESGQTDGLAGVIAQGIAQAEDKDRAIAQAVRVVSRLRDKRVALRVLEDALLPAGQGSSTALLALSDAAAAARATERAVSWARAAQALEPASEDAAQRVLEYGLAVDPQDALARTRQFLQEHPQARRVHLFFVNRLMVRGETEEALAHIRSMRAHTPEDFDLMVVQAQIHVLARQNAQARALLDEYIQVQTQRRTAIAQDAASDAMTSVADARFLLARIADQEGDFDQALAQLDRIDDPALDFDVLLQRAALLGKQGKISQARAALENFAPRNVSERARIAVRLADIYRNAGRTDDAVRVLENAVRENPDSIQIQYDLAMLYERQGRMDAFEERLRRVLEIDPDNANAYNALGYTLADQNRRLDDAGNLLERAEQLEPDNPYILDSVGWYHYRRGNLALALNYLRRSWADMPAADVAAHLGEVLWVMRRPDEAREVWREGQTLDPGNDTLRKTLESLGVTLP